MLLSNQAPKSRWCFTEQRLIVSRLLWSQATLYLCLRWLSRGRSKNDLNLHTNCWNKHLLLEGVNKYTLQVAYLLPTVSILRLGLCLAHRCSVWINDVIYLKACYFAFLSFSWKFECFSLRWRRRGPKGFQFTLLFNHMENFFYSSHPGRLMSLLCSWKYR